MAEDKSVLAIFVDVRGFTKWSEANEVFINLGYFVTGFLSILSKHFASPAYTLKPLGDGALLVSEIADEDNPKRLTSLLSKVLATTKRVENEFAKHCQDFSKRVGHSANLRLGWGIVRGRVIKVGDDWAGHNLNKCSRLCDEARPFGVVIDRDDFPELPRDAKSLTSQVRRLRNVGEVSVWVSAEIASQFVPRERLRETPEVHVAGSAITEDKAGRIQVLLAKRAKDRKLFPDKFEGCGGQLRYSETFVDGIRRHFHQELELDVDVIEELHCFYTIREPEEPVIPGIRFLCRRVGHNEPRSANHSELRWVTEEELSRMPSSAFIEGLKPELIGLLERYKAARQQ